jgi:phenylacetate-CoA ligase
MLFGYPSALSMLARHADNRGWRLKDAGVKVAFVTAERLYDSQREAISRAFGCAVANGYGARDAGFVAHECPRGGMHIMAEDVIVEIIDGGGRVLPPGRAGEIVITHLASGDFPFIRYRTGDVGVLDDADCPCGRGLPLLREIQGRSTDFVVAQDGTVMHGLSLIYVLRELPGIAQFRITQESKTLTRVELVRGPDFSPDTVSKIKAGLAARLGPAVTIEVETRAILHAEPSGKFRYVQSKVAA